MNDKLEAEFTESEQAEIVEAIKKMPVLAEGDVPSFKMLIRWIEVWYRLVNQIEEGYRLTIYDYHNDMDIRWILSRLMNLVQAETALKIRNLIALADEKYFDSTLPLENPERAGFIYISYDKKWWRKPKKLIGELKEDFEKRKIE